MLVVLSGILDVEVEVQGDIGWTLKGHRRDIG